MINDPPTRIRANGKIIDTGKAGNRKILGSRKIPPRMISIQPEDRFPAIRTNPTRIRITGHEKTSPPTSLNTIHTGLKISLRWRWIFNCPKSQNNPTMIRITARVNFEPFSEFSFFMALIFLIQK
jgi:hypothetical protein